LGRSDDPSGVQRVFSRESEASAGVVDSPHVPASTGKAAGSAKKLVISVDDDEENVAASSPPFALRKPEPTDSSILVVNALSVSEGY
jgi:hypothetical protein